MISHHVQGPWFADNVVMPGLAAFSRGHVDVSFLFGPLEAECVSHSHGFLLLTDSGPLSLV